MNGPEPYRDLVETFREHDHPKPRRAAVKMWVLGWMLALIEGRDVGELPDDIASELSEQPSDPSAAKELLVLMSFGCVGLAATTVASILYQVAVVEIWVPIVPNVVCGFGCGANPDVLGAVLVPITIGGLVTALLVSRYEARNQPVDT
jgi:hypothetical protein